MRSWSAPRIVKGGGIVLGLVTVVAVALVSLGMIFASPVSAEEPLTINKMRVQVQPEYDESRVLVIYQGDFTGPTDLSRKVEFKVPKGSDIQQVCGLRKPQDEHLCQLYETSQQDDSVLLTYTLPVKDFYFELYYNPIQGGGLRDIDFVLPATYRAETVDIEVQEPKRATDFKLTPETNVVGTTSEGFKSYRYTYNKVEPGKNLPVKISYNRPDSNPSITKKVGNSSSSTAASTGADANSLVLLVIVGAVIVVGLYFFLRRSPGRPAPAMSYASRSAYASRPAGAPSRPNPGPAPKSGGRFCTSCGKPATSGDAFCGTCGAPLKRKR